VTLSGPPFGLSVMTDPLSVSLKTDHLQQEKIDRRQIMTSRNRLSYRWCSENMYKIAGSFINPNISVKNCLQNVQRTIFSPSRKVFHVPFATLKMWLYFQYISVQWVRTFSEFWGNKILVSRDLKMRRFVVKTFLSVTLFSIMAFLIFQIDKFLIPNKLYLN